MDEQPQRKKEFTNTDTLLFIVILSVVSALILSVLASALATPKEVAKELDRSKQMLIAAKILDHGGYFLLNDKPAHLDGDGVLVPAKDKEIATTRQLAEMYKRRFRKRLVDGKGDLFTFEQAKIDEAGYIAKYKKTGYYKEPFKLIYELLSNAKNDPKIEGYVIPINGFGLWDAIYGYLAIETNGDTIIGISWYDQKETPGLGANIADAPWQSLFPGKKIFQQSPGGKTNYQTAPLGIVVVKGKVQEVLGDSPKAESAVDGMAGATLTGNGVTDAYRDCLAPYRPFLIKLHDQVKK